MARTILFECIPLSEHRSPQSAMEIFNDSANRRLVMISTSKPYTWADLPAPTGTTARSTIVGYLEHPRVTTRLMVRLIERRRTTTADSSYTAQILVGHLIPYGEESNELFEYNHPLQAQRNLWCSKCYADSPAADGTGAVKIPESWKGRYFAGLPRCSNCAAALNFWDVPLALEIGSAYVVETINTPSLQKWVEQQLVPHGIFAVTAARRHGPASSLPFQEELLAMAFCPARVDRIVELGGKAALSDLMGCAEAGSGSGHPDSWVLHP